MAYQAEDDIRGDRLQPSGCVLHGQCGDPPSGNLSDQAYKRIVDMMLSGVLVAGEVLQERRLAEALNTSRSPVREALGRLETEGLVSRPSGRVVTVANVGPAGYIEALDVRSMLEVEAAALAAGRISRRTVERIRTSIWALMEAETPTPSEHWAVDDLVHGTIAEAAGNILLAGMIRDLRRRTHIFNTRRIPGRRRPGALEHLALIDAVYAGDADKSRQLMVDHIRNVKAAILRQIKLESEAG